MSAHQAALQAAYDVALAKLKGKQRLFVEAYVGSAQFNGAEAARQAGYGVLGARKQASRMSTNVDICAAIHAALALRTLSAAEVLMRLSDHARGTLDDFLTCVEEAGKDGAEGVRIWSLDLNKAKRAGMLHLVKRLTYTRWGWSIELYDAQAALLLLARHYGLLFGGAGPVKGLDPATLDDASLARLAAGEAPRVIFLDAILRHQVCEDVEATA